MLQNSKYKTLLLRSKIFVPQPQNCTPERFLRNNLEPFNIRPSMHIDWYSAYCVTALSINDENIKTNSSNQELYRPSHKFEIFFFIIDSVFPSDYKNFKNFQWNHVGSKLQAFKLYHLHRRNQCVLPFFILKTVFLYTIHQKVTNFRNLRHCHNRIKV